MSDEETVVYPTAALRDLIEATATDEELSPSARAKELDLLREELRGLLGFTEQRLGEANLLRDVESTLAEAEWAEAWERVELREELIRRGLADGEKLNGLGYPSREALQIMLAESLDADPEELREALGRAFGLGLKKGLSFNRLVRRDRRGKFQEMPDHEEVGSIVKGQKVKRVFVNGKGQKRYAYETPKTSALAIADNLNSGNTHPAATPIARSRKIGANNEGSKKAADLTPGEDPSSSFEARRAASYEKRKKALDRRVSDSIASGTAEDAETGGGITSPHGLASQRRLLDFAREAASEPTTAEQHAVRQENGELIFDPDRAALHAEVIDLLLRQRNDDGSVNAGGAPIPSQDQPGVFFSGGGYAAGKGSILRPGPDGKPFVTLPFDGKDGQDFLTIDPDQIKALLPEYAETLEADPEANLLVYEEAWAISQQLQAIAQERKINVVVDGITDSSPDEVLDRVESFTKAGYSNPEVAYVDIPTEEALKRAGKRAREAKSASDRRHIPEPIMRAVHRDVAGTIPRVLDSPRARQLGLKVSVYDNRGGNDQPPTLMASRDADQGGFTIADNDLWQDLLKKADEDIDVVTEPSPAEEFTGRERAGAPELRNPALAGALSPPAPVEFQPGTEDHPRYFDLAGAEVAAIDGIAPSGVVDADALAAARAELMGAARGGQKVPLIKVTRNEDGTLSVEDGNATLEAAKDLGWEDVPVEVTNAPEGALSPPLPSREESEEALFNTLVEAKLAQQEEDPRYDDMSDDDLRQEVAARQARMPKGSEVDTATREELLTSVKVADLYEKAERYYPVFRELLNEGVGVVDEVGGKTSSLMSKPGTPEFARSLKNTQDVVRANPESAHAIIGAVKDFDKALSKIGRLGGDTRMATDIVRGSILVPQEGQLAQVHDILKRRAAEMGWTISQTGSRFTEREGSDSHRGALANGYKDINLRLASPDGFQMEVQLNTIALWEAKDVRPVGADPGTIKRVGEHLTSGGSVDDVPEEAFRMFAGHDFFDVDQALLLESTKRDLTEEEQRTREEMDRRMSQTYGEAEARSGYTS